MNINYRNVFIALIASLLLAVPTAAILNHKNNQIEIEKSNSNRLQLDIEKRESELQKSINEKIKSEKKLKEEAEKIKQENERLKRELQAKAERKAEQARIAAANAEKQAAVSVAPRNVGVASGDCYASLLSKYDWDVGTMQRIMRAESGCNPTNHNHGDRHATCLGSYGLLQIGCVHGYSASYLSTPANNIAVAYNIFKSQGYTAWTTY